MGYNWGHAPPQLRRAKPPKKPAFVLTVWRRSSVRYSHRIARMSRSRCGPKNGRNCSSSNPATDPPLLVEPFGLTDPELNSPEILPPEMTNLSVALPQGVPTATETHAPSKLPPPPPPPSPLLFATRGAAHRLQVWRVAPALRSSTARGVSREPDSDFSSLPMLPPALPDCASAAPRYGDRDHERDEC